MQSRVLSLQEVESDSPRKVSRSNFGILPKVIQSVHEGTTIAVGSISPLRCAGLLLPSLNVLLCSKVIPRPRVATGTAIVPCYKPVLFCIRLGAIFMSFRGPQALLGRKQRQKCLPITFSNAHISSLPLGTKSLVLTLALIGHCPGQHPLRSTCPVGECFRTVRAKFAP
jgi:hypothetical protein